MLAAMLGMGPGIRGVFRSRWNALWWAAGMCMTAYCSMPDPDEPGGAKSDPTAAGQKAAQKDAEQLQKLLGPTAAAPSKSESKSPWALDPPPAPAPNPNN